MVNKSLKRTILNMASPQNCLLARHSGALRAPECGAELALPTADLFGCALIRAPEQSRWSEKS